MVMFSLKAMSTEQGLIDVTSSAVAGSASQMSHTARGRLDPCNEIKHSLTCCSCLIQQVLTPHHGSPSTKIQQV